MLSTLLFLLTVFLVYLFIKQYNLLQNLSGEIRETRTNIMAFYEKKVSIINEFINLVNELDGYEKLTSLKLSNTFVEMTRETSKAVENITALVNQFPDLKAHTQYAEFQEYLRENDILISNKREVYNYQVKQYNSTLAQIPMVFAASLLGFKEAPFFEPNREGAFSEFSGADSKAIKDLAKKGCNKLKETTEKVSETLQKKEQEAQAKREERIRQEREAASNNEKVTAEENTDQEVPKAEDTSEPDASKTGDSSTVVEKQEEKQLYRIDVYKQVEFNSVSNKK